MSSELDWRELPSIEFTPILEAALDAFYESGFHGASVREVASRVGLTVPSLYYHHQNKEGLLFAVLERALLAIVERVELADAEGRTPSERLAYVTEAIVLIMTVYPRAAALDTSEARYLTGQNLERYLAIRRRIERITQQIVTDGIAAGDFSVDDAPEVVRAILGMTQAIPRWYDLQGRNSPQLTASHYASLALRLVGSKDAAVS